MRRRDVGEAMADDDGGRKLGQGGRRAQDPRAEPLDQRGIGGVVVEEAQHIERGSHGIDVANDLEDLASETARPDDDERGDRQRRRHQQDPSRVCTPILRDSREPDRHVREQYCIGPSSAAAMDPGDLAAQWLARIVARQ